MSQVIAEQNYGVRVRQNAGPQVSNTTTETDLVNVTVPANRMGTNKVLTFTSTSLLTTPAISLPSITIRGRFGNSIFLTTSSISLALNQTNTPFTIAGTISLNDAANSQSAVANFVLASNNAPLVLTGNSALQTMDMTEDTTVDVAFRLTAQFGGLSGTTSIQHKFTQVVMS